MFSGQHIENIYGIEIERLGLAAQDTIDKFGHMIENYRSTNDQSFDVSTMNLF